VFAAGLLQGKRALITGGGTGLGRSIGQRYLELGAELVICGRRKEVLEATAKELSAATGGTVTPIQCDVRDAEAVDAMMEQIWKDQPLDILINNAAGNFLAQTHKLSPRAIDSVLNIVLHGAAYCTVAAGKRWIEAKHKGVVLSILTLSALNGAPFTVPSAMAKAGVLAMTKSLAVEWGGKGIRLVAVAPGPFPTPGAWERLMPEQRAKAAPIENSIPLRRVGQHEELANLCSFLVSDQAGYINGDCIVIDGGKMLQSGGGGVNTSGMLDWTDEQWDALKPKK